TSDEGRILEVSGTATAEPLRLADVLVGEVWLASGQSNMDFTVARTEKYTFAGVVNESEEVAAATYPRIRMFKGDWQKAAEPCERVGGRWLVCTPENVREFSAVGYFFARRLHRELGVPVGILAQTFGATTAQAWVSREAMAADPRTAEQLRLFDEQLAAYRADPGLREKHQVELAAWREAAEAAKARGERAPRAPADPDPVANQRNPAVMFNGMIAPVLPYALRGVIWYQGESITAPRELFPVWNAMLIRDWRARWGRELPFYFVQLAGHGGRSNTPEVRAWQAEALALPATGMALAYDIGDKADVHPKNKQDVGDRLARLALARTYGRAVVDTGPVAKAVTRAARDGADVVRVEFAHAHGGLVARGGGEPGGFEVAGADGNFVAARARITGDAVEVSAEGVPRVEAVRYAWAAWPEGADLGNAAGLPAAPFALRIGQESKTRE
ncbi:MAG: sialate O-acetylesterase, partial [Opitutaceae bacterium]|nr:sialate O-acetylesterase [Opitutaceae bacterium]